MHHFAVIDFIDDEDEEELASQQSMLDTLDDQITARLEELAARRPPGVDKVANVTFNCKRLKYLERAFASVSENLSSLDTGLQQHLQDLKKELSDVHQEYMSADHEDHEEHVGHVKRSTLHYRFGSCSDLHHHL